MNKKGFTLVEILVVIAIIGFISGIGVVSYQTFFKTGEEKYYEAIESDMLLAGNDYFTDHRDLLPTGNGVYPVDLSDLIESKYLEPIKDKDGNLCTEGQVYVYRENNKYKYEACLMNCGGHSSTGKYCDGTAESNVINIDAYVVGTNEKYDATKPYNSVKYLQKNQKIKVTFTMDNEKAAYYEAVNTTVSGVSYHCTKNSSGLCDITVDKSGTYKVTAYDSSDSATRKVIASNQYFSVRITKAGPQFSITGVDKSVISLANSACGSTTPKIGVTYTVVKSNINEEYKNVEYKIDRYRLNSVQSAGTYKETTGNNRLIINETLPSGKYRLYVRVTNFANEQTVEYKDFDISYFVNVTYSDNDYNGLDSIYNGMDPKHFEVVADQQYDYLGLKYSANRPLPQYKVAYTKRLEIRWHLKTEEFSEARRIFGTSTVDKNCTYGIEGLMAIPVAVPSDWTAYCAKPTYNGGTQSLTSNPPTDVFFLNKDKVDAGTYTVTAHIDAPYYIWSDNWTFDDRTFSCPMLKRDTTCTSNSDSKTYDATALTKGGGSCTNLVSGHTPTFTNTGSITNVGSTPNTISNITINSGGLNVTNNYNITRVTGTLTVNKRPTTCTSASDSKTYDATALTKGGGSCTNLVSGHTSTFTNTGSITNVGSVSNGISSVTISGGGANVTSNYSISYSYGTLTVNKRNTTCTSNGDSKTYDGSALTKGGGSCSNLVSGHSASFSNNGSITNAGSVANGIASLTISAGGTNVTSNYNISYSYGTLKVNKRGTTCTSNSASKTYDGNALTKGGGSCSNLVGGHSASFSNSGSITNAGSTANTISSVTITGGGANVTGNYSISYSTGTLTVNPKPIGSCPGSPSNKTYTGNSISSGVNCPANATTRGTTSATNTGNYTQTCTGEGNYTGSCSITWSIVTSCNEGYYLPSGSQTCKTCKNGYYCKGISSVVSTGSDQGLTSCPSGYGSSSSPRTKKSNCYKSCSYQTCAGHYISVPYSCNTACNPCTEWRGGTEYCGAYSDGFTGCRCLEDSFVCKNGSSFSGTGPCVYLNNTESNHCYNGNWAVKTCGPYCNNNCDCRAETGYETVTGTEYYGGSCSA